MHTVEYVTPLSGVQNRLGRSGESSYEDVILFTKNTNAIGFLVPYNI